MPRITKEIVKSPCGCGTCGPAAVEGRRSQSASRAAVQVDPELKKSNLTHLRRIEGQVRGLARLVEEDRYCADIITQISAVRESLQSVAKNLLRNHLKHCASAALRSNDDRADSMREELLDLIGRLAR